MPLEADDEEGGDSMDEDDADDSEGAGNGNGNEAAEDEENAGSFIALAFRERMKAPSGSA